MNIKTGFTAVATAALAFSCLGDAAISQVVVRQQWPWSTKINVDFTLANETGSAVDIMIVATNGNSEVALPNAALSGSRIGLSTSGNYRIVIDPAKLDLGSQKVLGDFKVSLSVAAARADYNEVLYRIYALDGSLPQRKDVTVADLLNGKYGSCETDYTYANDGVWNPGEVLIWTDVTNNPAYKTTHLVLRKVPHGSFTMCQYAHSPGTSVTLTKDYFIGVFEMTQAQYGYVNPGHGISFNNAGDDYPAESVTWSLLRCGQAGNERNWPDVTTVNANSLIGKLRTVTGDGTFDLPTEARWEYACRAGSTTHWNNGEDSTATGASNLVAPKLGRIKHYDGGTDSTVSVGSYLPNAWGLYDMHGNVAELCLDRWTASESLSIDSTDPDGGNTADITLRVVKGGPYTAGPASQYVDKRDTIKASAGQVYNGFRVICEAE